MHLLCRNGENHPEWYVMSASADAAPLQSKADALNLEEYSREHAEWLERGKVGQYPLPLDAPERRGYRTFFVQEVPDWPGIEEA